MEWNMKEASWDLGELDEATGLPNIEAINEDGSSRFGSDDRRITGEFCVDLKLGQVGNSSCSNEPAMVAKWKDVFGGVSKVMMTTPSSSSSSGSSKRARALNNGGSQAVSCLVDGCNSDLSNCRDYHRRHKVCELHSKTPVVTIGGHKQRFCQQCSRFHSLEEFDEGKRSCRKRLDGHNRRRRKQPPQQQQAEGAGRCGSLLSNYQQGNHLLPFSGSHMYPSTAMAHPAWNSDVRLHHHHHHQNQQLNHLVDHKEDLFLGSLSSLTYTEANNNNNKQQLAFLQGDHNSTTMENNQRNNEQEAQPPPASVCQTFLRAATPSLPAATLHGDHHDSHCALSLLSSPQTHTSGNGLSQLVQPHHHQHQHQQAMSSVMQHHHHQALGLSLHDHGLETADSVMAHHVSDHSPTTMYNMNEAPPPFPFHWE